MTDAITETMTESVTNPEVRHRNRKVLIAIVVLFFGAFLLAGVLRFSGWRPAGMKNHGELLQPPTDLRALSPVLAAGGAYRWNPTDRVWRVLVAAPADCGNPCVVLSRDLDTVWRLFGRNADRVHVLWLGPLPESAVRNRALRALAEDPALRAALPRANDPARATVYVVDPNGFVILRYAPGFDPAHLREDMNRLLKLR